MLTVRIWFNLFMVEGFRIENKNKTFFKSGQKWLKNNYVASLIYWIYSESIF